MIKFIDKLLDKIFLPLSKIFLPSYKIVEYERIDANQKEKEMEKFFEMLENATESITIVVGDLDFSD
jgi:uncharacterized Fe-S radical SAM superfamily protein PflX